MAYTTLSLVEAEVRASESFSTSTVPTQAQVTSWIAQSQGRIDSLASRSFEVQEYIETISFKQLEDYIYLKNTPVVSITSVEYNPIRIGEAPQWETKTADVDYVVEPLKGRIEFTTKWSPREGSNVFRVTYLAGFTDIPSSVEELATKMVASRVMSSAVNESVSTASAGTTVRVGALSVVNPSNFGTAGMYQLDQDIKQLKSEIVTNFGVYRYNNG